MNTKILKLHDYDKDATVVEATELCHNGKDVIRKLEIAKAIAKEPGCECIKTAAKNSIVYAAVKVQNPVTEEDEVVCRIYDTTVFTRNRKHYISYKMYEENDYMPIEVYEVNKAKLESLDPESTDYQKLKDKLNLDKKYVLPTGCHSSVLKLLTPSAVKNVQKWRMDCKDVLATLASEKLFEDSLTNLPLLSKIKLMEIRSNGDPIYLIKDNEGNFKYPIWIDDVTGKKYKIKEIQQIGFEIVSKD